jgi:hypothetical protein
MIFTKFPKSFRNKWNRFPVFLWLEDGYPTAPNRAMTLNLKEVMTEYKLWGWVAPKVAEFKGKEVWAMNKAKKSFFSYRFSFLPCLSWQQRFFSGTERIVSSDRRGSRLPAHGMDFIGGQSADRSSCDSPDRWNSEADQQRVKFPCYQLFKTALFSI